MALPAHPQSRTLKTSTVPRAAKVADLTAGLAQRSAVALVRRRRRHQKSRVPAGGSRRNPGHALLRVAVTAHCAVTGHGHTYAGKLVMATQPMAPAPWPRLALEAARASSRRRHRARMGANSQLRSRYDVCLLSRMNAKISVFPFSATRNRPGAGGSRPGPLPCPHRPQPHIVFRPAARLDFALFSLRETPYVFPARCAGNT